LGGIELKIVGFLSAKNEGDIIESICRHTATFCDEILLNYAESSDNTLEIIEKLIVEGLPIRLIDRAQFTGKPNAQDITILLRLYERYVFDSLQADWFIPVDSDEFLFGIGACNPRSELETLSEDKYYIIPRRNYIYKSRLNDNTKFLPTHFNRYAAMPPVAHGKTLLSRYMWEKIGAHFIRGWHSLVFSDNVHYSVEETNLLIRHFPVRSKEQFTLQTAINWLDMKNNVQTLDNGQHIGRMYEYIRSKKCIMDGDLSQLSKTYAYPRLDIEINEVVVDEVYEPLDEVLSFEKIELKYTDYSYYTKQENTYYNALVDGFDALIKKMRHNALKMTPGPDKAACIKQRGVYGDDWCGPDVEIGIATGDKGYIHITGYYPNEITGKETGKIYIDDFCVQEFVVDEPLFHITVPTLKNANVSLEIISDFSFPATAPDVRTLSFVLSDIYAE
jgi:hypothetical protein